MPSRDLGSTTTERELLERVLERKLDLLRVPPSSETLDDVLTPRYFHPETFEAQRAWADGGWIIARFAEAVTRFPRAAAGTERRLAILRWARRRLSRSRFRDVVQP